MKKTETWRLTYCRPYHGFMPMNLFPTDSRNKISGQDEYLLTTGKIINRPAKPELGESCMTIPLTSTTERYNQFTRQNEKHACVIIEVPIGKIESTDPSYIKIMELNKIKLDFMKRSIYVSYLDFKGRQLNENFPDGAGNFYILENLDAIERDKSINDEKIKTLGYELIQIKKSEEDFKQLCYLFGVNISQMNFDTAYNILSTLLEKDPLTFDKKMNDPERRYRIVINKALRTKMPSYESNYITEETTGEFTTYYQNGKLLATGYDALIGYYKENVEIFDALAHDLDLGAKKNGQASPKLTEEELTEEEPKRRGRTKAVQEV